MRALVWQYLSPPLISAALIIATPSKARDGDDSDDAQPEAPEIIVYGRELTQIGVAQSGSQGVVGYADLENRPLLRVGELVENVPGVIATQHSGTGKANQYFLRGFNLDHGTDFAGFVDNVPINMRTHGHGQGYLDLNFLIPELVERIDYRKGPYFTDIGDFAAAGTVVFATMKTLPRPLVEATIGSHDYYRALAAGSFDVGGKDLLLALEGTFSNGPWDLDEDLHKVNGLAKLSHGSLDEGWSLDFTVYHADWNSTDQVPKRAIDGGLIDLFGFIDPDLGGRTTRLGLTVNGASGMTAWTGYAIFYDFKLTSDFTYFLEDPISGDEFQQRDSRGVFGGRLNHRIQATLAGRPLNLTLGGDFRYDRISKVGLYHSVGGIRTNTVRQDQVDEYSTSLSGEASLALDPRLRLMFGLRGDLYGYDVDAGLVANSGDGWDAIIAPKAAVAWRPSEHVEIYANYGHGFHSNDVRGATISVDPVTGEPADRVGVLVRAKGAELGGRVEIQNLTASLVSYYLKLGSELVFVGDAGTTEPNAPSRRYGAEASLFWRPVPWLALDASGAVTHARFEDVPDDEDRIPNSVSKVLSAGATVETRSGFSASLRLRHFGQAPLIEDDSRRSNATTVVNLGGYYRTGRVRLGIDALNLFDSRDADITYFYTSRLQGEPPEGVEDYHIHPVEPRQVRITLRYTF